MPEEAFVEFHVTEVGVNPVHEYARKSNVPVCGQYFDEFAFQPPSVLLYENGISVKNVEDVALEYEEIDIVPEVGNVVPITGAFVSFDTQTCWASSTRALLDVGTKLDISTQPTVAVIAITKTKRVFFIYRNILTLSL